MNKKRVIIESVVTTVFLALLIYSAYSLWYVFYGTDSGADVHLYTVLSGCAIGWFLCVLTGAIFKQSGLVPRLMAFLAGNALFQGLIWGVNARLNESCTDNESVVIMVYTVSF